MLENRMIEDKYEEEMESDKEYQERINYEFDRESEE